MLYTIKRTIEGILYIFPSFLLFSVFVFYPMVRTGYLSFYMTDFQGTPTTYIGLEHFLYLLEDRNFKESLKATFLFVLYTVPTTVVISFGLALLANEKLRGIQIFRTIFSSTLGMSVAASSVIWMFMYNPAVGIINRLILAFGWREYQWLLNPDTALAAVAIATVWMNIGFSFLILLGGLQNIDITLYESAKVLGLSRMYQLWRITIPLLSPTLFFIVTVSLIHAFQTFGQIDILTKGGPMNTTTVLVYSIYREAFINYNFGFASAQAVILFLIVLIVTFLQFVLVERKVHYQ
ncbi:sugar ABC transporter permease [Anoxybacillus ayderensis]|uniref:carbohydrate ABC transporter permease n=1 Tax=Anoxybacillus sp. ST70 TaxID=2864180 RepID=UPI0002E360E3|nr:sugar ABC transporter permease [Anoxybacillus sp. ST70]AXM87754.1 sugar ABC transporter permease [Anoxybacillus ayderensis G10]MBW9218485.1 sugar ABC transporter permease [Anoxybacillus sp. ST70]THD16237.1 sugar ABC transporter permease [Anoxybacillus ayderensis]